MSDLYPDHREDLQSRSQIGGSTFSCKPHPGERERERERERKRERERERERRRESESISLGVLPPQGTKPKQPS